MASVNEMMPMPAAEAGRQAFSIRATLNSWAAELAPFPGRWRRAARVAFVTAIGAGLMASVQIVNPLGLTLLVSLAVPEFALGLGTAICFLVAAAAIQTLTLFLAGATIDNPVVHICVFIAFAAVTTYLIYGVPRLGRLWLWIQIPAATAFYMVVFDRKTLGWDNAQMFSGVAIAVALLWLFNNVIWPEPATSVLARSLTTTLARSRRRLSLLIGIFVGDTPVERDRAVASKLAYHMALAAPVTRAAGKVRTTAALLATVMVAERIHNQIDRLCIPACSQAGASLSDATKRELVETAGILETALDEYIAGIGPDGESKQPGHFDSLAAFRARLQALDEAAEGAMGAVIGHLKAIGYLLSADALELPDEATAEPVRHRSGEPFRLNKFLVRFCARHTVAMTIAFVAGLFDNNAAIHAALWLLMIGGPPSHGATARKFTVRAIGAAAAMAMTAVGTILLAPNGTTIFSYMAAVFAGCLIMAYIGQGGGLLSYLSIGGTAFVIAFSGPGPRNDEFASIWTIWGISFGMLIRAVVSMFWREWPRRTLVEEFQPPVRALMLLVSAAHRRDFSAAQIEAAGMALIGGVREMLAVANDAQLEGRGA